MAKALTIGQLAQATGVPPKTIRDYEDVGVLPPPLRTSAGYRQYTERSVHRVLFVRRARALGLSLQQLKVLSAALDSGPRGVMRRRLLGLVRAQRSTVQQQIAELEFLQRQLEQVLSRLLRPAPMDHTEGCRCLEAAEERTPTHP
jgi:MerR family transcriptional regulator, copper efflux regulator